MQNEIKNTATAMSRIGAQLKEAREKKSVTIDQVQKQTRIHSTVLKALEDGRCDEMLTTTYVKSFLKKYAEYLGLDSRGIINEYAKTHPAGPVPNLAVKSSLEPARPIDMSNALPAIGYVIFAAAVIAAVVIAGFGAVRIVKAIGGLSAHSKAGAKDLTVRPSALAAAKKRAAPKPASQKEPAVKTEAPVKAAAQPAPVVQVAPTVSIPKAAPIKLLLKVNRKTMIKLRVDGNLLFERVLSPGTVESFTANDRINIYAGKAEAIELFLNGRGLGSPGKGVMKNIEITRTGLKIK